MQTNDEMLKSVAEKTTEATQAVAPPEIAPAYNGADRNAWIFGWNPQQELWNGRLAMIGFVAYLLWDLSGYSVVRDVLGLLR